ncbi:MAG: flagellar hook-basal body complex protein FliE [Spirochaetaceae bacterium]|jgi:flagellar hook-basal body complex protein FliE|nr:flagellar hook-basal body complex protein FliE [Spirochaetaceae bacterium]
MVSIKPELQKLNPLAMFQTDSRHMASGGVVGFSGSYDHGGALSDLTPAGKGTAIAKLGAKIGVEEVLRSGSLGAEGLGRVDNANFANAMLNALDTVSAQGNFAEELTQRAIIDPESVNAHDVTTAQLEASLSLTMARTILSRLTQAWRDLINIR